MDLTDVEMFLSIVSTKSISKSAEALFLSQPTMSHRLKLLEKELNCSLIVRNKGFKQIELTQAGLDFIPIAERMLSLWKETRLLQQRQERRLLTIGCTDSVNVALLSPFYRQLIRGDSVLDLSIRTHQSAELYGILDAHDIDLAFVYYQLYYKNITCECVFEEQMYLVQSSNPAVAKPLVHTDELDPAKELFLKWDDPYQIWHDQWLTNYARPCVSTDTIAVISKLWSPKEQYWMIAPESVIHELYGTHSLYVSRLENSPPNRQCYKIKHRFPLAATQPALDYFEEKLEDYLHGLKFDLHIGQVWQRY